MANPPLGEAAFEAIGTKHRILSTNPDCIDEAAALAQEHLADLDAAISRFRPDSEVSRLFEASSHGPITALISPMFTDYLQAALWAAEVTDGLVDPSVGAAVSASGYDDDMDAVRARGDLDRATTASVPGWQKIELDAATRLVTVPTGCLIDLGATAKAHAADRVAQRLAHQLGGGFLVNFGGDIAVIGEVPDGGWQIGVQAADGSVRQVIASQGQAVATSSTQLRTWTVGMQPRHHIIDPRTGRTAPTVWAQVSCVAVSSMQANAASTASIVLGADAPDWLTERGVPARLDGIDGSVITTPGWPEPA